MIPIGTLVFEAEEQGTTTDKEKEESGKKAAKRRIKLRKGVDPEVFAGEDKDKDTK
jgi:hypothetical protein